MTIRVFSFVPLAAMLLTAGCSSMGHLSAVSNPAVVLSNEDGAPVMTSEKHHRVVVRLLTPKFSRKLDQLPAFSVTLTNRGESPLVFSPEGITATSASNRVRVYTANEMGAKITNEGNFERFLATSRGAAQLRAAIMSQPGQAAPPTITAKMYALTERTAAEKATTAQLSGLRFMLYPNIVEPGAVFGGIMKLDAEDITEGVLKLEVKAGDEIHEFLFRVDARS
jgi:hypothetical protein